MNPARTTSSLAIASLVSGILGWTLLPVLGTLVAIVTGHMARAEIRRSGGALEGDGLAIGGLWATTHYLLPKVSAVLQAAPLVGSSDIWYVAPWLAVFMLGVAVLTSWVTLRRYLRV